LEYYYAGLVPRTFYQHLPLIQNLTSAALGVFTGGMWIAIEFDNVATKQIKMAKKEQDEPVSVETLHGSYANLVYFNKVAGMVNKYKGVFVLGLARTAAQAWLTGDCVDVMLGAQIAVLVAVIGAGRGRILFRHAW
jgi:hypothetical protein